MVCNVPMCISRDAAIHPISEMMRLTLDPTVLQKTVRDDTIPCSIRTTEIDISFKVCILIGLPCVLKMDAVLLKVR